VRPWDGRLLVVAVCCATVGTAFALVIRSVDLTWSALGSSFALWALLVGAVIYGLSLSRPAGLLSFRGLDLLWGVATALALRFLHGLISEANLHPFPSAPLAEGAVTQGWWSSVVFPAVVVAPLVEELFFRGVILVTIYQIFRRGIGSVSAAVTAVLSSGGMFVMLHAAFDPLGWAEGMQLLAVGLMCSALVLATGRVWSAVIAHFFFNASYVGLALLGYLLSSG